jgi:hypothetical protein
MMCIHHERPKKKVMQFSLLLFFKTSIIWKGNNHFVKAEIMNPDEEQMMLMSSKNE